MWKFYNHTELSILKLGYKRCQQAIHNYLPDTGSKLYGFVKAYGRGTGGLVFLVSLEFAVKSCIVDQVKYMVHKGLKRETIQPVQDRVRKPMWLEKRSLGMRTGK